MCIFHKWTKWEEYERDMIVTPGLLAPKELRGKTFEVVQQWQKRTCLKCGYTQRKKLDDF